MNLLASAIVTIFGAIFASFLSVVTYRLRKKNKNILSGRSICPSCRKKLKWHHLVPVFSWIFLRGKCAYCGKNISVHYLAMEITTGLLYLAIFLNWNFIVAHPTTLDPTLFTYSIDWQIFNTFIYHIIISTFLIAIFFFDLKNKEIPDRLSLPAIAIAIAGGLTLHTVAPLSMLLGGLGILAFFALQFFLSKGTWIGGGDLRLGLLMGVYLGWEYGLLALVMAYIIGALISIVLILKRAVSRKTAVPFGPFLVTGTIISLFYGELILDWYLNILL